MHRVSFKTLNSHQRKLLVKIKRDLDGKELRT